MIRKATPDDARPIARLHRQVVRECLPFLPELHTAEEDLEFFTNRFLPEHEVWVWGEKGIAGYCGFRDGWVDHLYVDTTHQGRGIGSALLRKPMERYEQLRLWVFQRNISAIMFYENHGFRQLEKTDGAGNQEREPDALYEWTKAIQACAIGSQMK